MRAMLIRNLDTLQLVLAAVLINLALTHGAGVHWGWWGFGFWAGFGTIFALLKKP